MKIVFMGTPDFAVPTLEALYQSRHEVAAVVTQPDKPKGRGKAMAMPPVKEKALEYLDEALKIEPDYPQALIRRGLALSQLGYADDAFDDLTKAIRIEPSAEAYLSRGICLLQQGNTAGARKDLEEALRRDDRSYRVWNILGAVSLKEGKEQEACEAFEKACSSGDCAGIEAARREKICK